ncbi:MAG: hypothetical protein GX621_11380 [Pirellulaceae bacterium]|nr:hypothetical protein [Pirellulaceae bacterium]
MLNGKLGGIRLTIGFVATLLLTAGSARAVCTQAVQHPGQPACSICCFGPCLCIPNAANWGYHARQWRPWPGDEYRQDVVFPQSIGVERVAAPRGERPKPMPREQYDERPRSVVRPSPVYPDDPNARQDLPPIREGLPTGPIEPSWPLDGGLDLNPSLPGPATGRPDSSSK